MTKWKSGLKNVHSKTSMKIKGNSQIDRMRGCGDKTRYMCPIAATHAAYNLEQIRGGTKYEIYPCRYCGSYHIGREKDRSMFDYGYDGAKHRPHPYHVWLNR